MFLVKLGGSVITDKRKPGCFHQQVMNRLAKEIKDSHHQLILVHGAGSFGHVLAKEYQLNEGFRREKQLQGFALTHARVQHLNSLVLEALHHHGLPAVSLPPHAFLTLNDHAVTTVDINLVDRYLQQGFLPLMFGDVVLDDTLGFSICSGDVLMYVLAQHFKPEQAVFVIDEEGLYSANPKHDSSARLFRDATLNDLEKLSTTRDGHADVTEGMKGKINTIKLLAHLGVDTVVVNGTTPHRLLDVLRGKEPLCTRIPGIKL